jgi:hypothetical protein
MKGVVSASLAGAVAGFLAALGVMGSTASGPHGGGLADVSLLAVATAREPGPQTIGDRDAPVPARPVPTDPQELDVAYAEISLKLLKLDLQKMTDLQARVRGSITASQFDRVDGQVRVAEEYLRLAREGKGTRGAHNVLRAREALRNAEFVWKTAQQVKVAANAISDIELARLRTVIDVERVMVARAEAAAAKNSMLDDLAWENDQLRDEVQRLRYRFEALTARR